MHTHRFFGSQQVQQATAGSVNTTNTWKATAYGVVDFCLYESDKDWTINTGDNAWDCTKWEDLPSSDCRKASANGLAWGIMGLLATAPAAVVCILAGPSTGSNANPGVAVQISTVVRAASYCNVDWS